MNNDISNGNTSPNTPIPGFNMKVNQRSDILEKEEIRLRRQQVKSSCGSGNQSRPRTLSTLSKKSSTMSDDQPIRMTDYLEKRSKMLGWKKYWFVLDGHLLTYYKSKDDYERISPFAGSVNLGIATTVRPIQIKGCKGYPIQIVTRSQIYYLRSQDKPLLDKWLLALQETTSTPPKISSPFWTEPGVQFYRYSFAALSQWSLRDSSDDITESLSNLPKNFYLNNASSGQLRKKCHSFASLPHPMADLNYKKDKEITELKVSDSRGRHTMSMLVPDPDSMGRDSTQTVHWGENQHRYDELIDFEALYDSSAATAAAAADMVIKNEDPWENMKMDTSNSNRKTLLPISEIPESNKGPEDNLISSQENIKPFAKDQMKKNKGIGGIFRKIFKKEEKKRPTCTPMVITGPVDLKSERILVHQKDISTKSDKSSPTEVTNDTAVMNNDVKSEVGPIQRAHSAEIVDESSESDQIQKANLMRRSTIQVSGTENSAIRQTPMTLLFQTSITEYQKKLARFNRLSAQLNPSFVAAMSKPIKQDVNVNVVLGQMGRANSCKIKHEEPPELPPKTARIMNVGNPNAYDYPCNNSPVRSKSDGVPWRQTIRELVKKNSAPEILFSGSSSSKERFPHILNDLGHEPPPRPPKKQQLLTECYLDGFINASENVMPDGNSTVAVSIYPKHHITPPEKGLGYKGKHEYKNIRSAPTLDIARNVAVIGAPPGAEIVKEMDHPASKIQTLGDDQIINLPNIEIGNRSAEISLSESGEIGDNEGRTESKDNTRSAKAETESKKHSLEPTEYKAERMSEKRNPAENEAQTNGDTSKPSENEDKIVSKSDIPTESFNESKIPSERNSESSDVSKFTENGVRTYCTGGYGVENTKSKSKSTEKNTMSSDSIVLLKNTPHSYNSNEHGLTFLQTVNSTENREEQIRKSESTENVTEGIRESPNSNVNVKRSSNESSKYTDSYVTQNRSTKTIENEADSMDHLAKSVETEAESTDKSAMSTKSRTSLSESEKYTEIGVQEIITTQDSKPNQEAVCQNVKYAEVHTLLTQFEAVEEEELLEMYDDFPTELVIPPLPTPSTTIENENDEGKMKNTRAQSIRHSGIDELQNYLSNNTDAHNDGPSVRDTTVRTGGALSRLGHSSAVDQLQRLLENN